METAGDALDLTPEQRARLHAYRDLLLHFNRSVNLISRVSARQVDEIHLLHSLSLTRKTFPAGSTVVDWGTGGGLPGLPLAICFPDVTFHLVDAVAKKIRAVRAMARRLDLTNVHAWHGRAEAWPGACVYSVSRATAPLEDLWSWHRRACAPWPEPIGPDAWPPGLLALKGGDLSDEIAALQQAFPAVRVEQRSLSDLISGAAFAGKVLVIVTEAGHRSSGRR